MRIRLDLAYDGTDYRGWQLQPGHDTVQGRIEDALARLFALAIDKTIPRIAVVAAGRTDAGVHAEGQVAHFDAPRPMPSRGLRIALNHRLPDSIRTLRATPAQPDFHARFDAVGKTYRYHLLTEPIPSPLRSRFAWAVGHALDLGQMEIAARAFLGAHDFRAFFHAAPGEEPETPVREIRNVRLFRQTGALVIEVTGDGFLRYMVRRMVGSLVAVGCGRVPTDSVRALLQNAQTPGPRFRAPACGLRLYRVWYRLGEMPTPEEPSDQPATAPRLTR